ncbi:MAG: sigma-E processing peptidase SpoIIGA [Clostridia bacterium]|nr:sigma-E processing peptidase SpoIIGA [Clostridia bacterium]
MKIVVEYVLISNFMINIIIFKTTALVLKERGRLFLLSSTLSACVTLVLPLLSLSALGCFILQFGLNILLVCISFKFRTLKKFFQIYLCFTVASFIYGGTCSLVASYIETQSLILLLLAVVGVYFVVKVLVKRISKKQAIENFCVDVSLCFSGQKTNWKGFLDSGNLLIDPLTQSPVSLINFKVFSCIFKDICLEDVLRKSEKLKKLKLAHYISFNTMGTGNKILVFQIDGLEIGGKHYKKAVLGLSLKNFNQAFGSDIILNNNFAYMCK